MKKTQILKRADNESLFKLLPNDITVVTILQETTDADIQYRVIYYSLVDNMVDFEKMVFADNRLVTPNCKSPQFVYGSEPDLTEIFVLLRETLNDSSRIKKINRRS